MNLKARGVTVAVVRAMGAGMITTLVLTPAFAQQAQKIEKIEVTGSNIKRIEGESALPVTVITRLNGVVKQQASTRDLIFPIAELLRYITATMTLEPGDLIPTGTPAGVGAVKPGDRIQVEIDGLGVLENEFAAE